MKQSFKHASSPDLVSSPELDSGDTETNQAQSLPSKSLQSRREEENEKL